MAGKFLQLIICLSVLSAPYLCSAADQNSCEEWLDSIKEYDDQVESIIQGEPEDLVKTFWKIIDVKESGEIQKAKDLQDQIKRKVSALKTINAPTDLMIFHKKLISYGMAVETSIAAIMQQDAPLRSVEVRQCFVSLLQFYEEMESLLIQHQCQNEDLRVIQEKIIPEIKGLLKQFPAELFDR
jgi:hypothetical protein